KGKPGSPYSSSSSDSDPNSDSDSEPDVDENAKLARKQAENVAKQKIIKHEQELFPIRASIITLSAYINTRLGANDKNEGRKQVENLVLEEKKLTDLINKEARKLRPTLLRPSTTNMPKLPAAGVFDVQPSSEKKIVVKHVSDKEAFVWSDDSVLVAEGHYRPEKKVHTIDLAKMSNVESIYFEDCFPGFIEFLNYKTTKATKVTPSFVIETNYSPIGLTYTKKFTIPATTIQQIINLKNHFEMQTFHNIGVEELGNIKKELDGLFDNKGKLRFTAATATGKPDILSVFFTYEQRYELTKKFIDNGLLKQTEYAYMDENGQRQYDLSVDAKQVGAGSFGKVSVLAFNKGNAPMAKKVFQSKDQIQDENSEIYKVQKNILYLFETELKDVPGLAAYRNVFINKCRGQTEIVVEMDRAAGDSADKVVKYIQPEQKQEVVYGLLKVLTELLNRNIVYGRDGHNKNVFYSPVTGQVTLIDFDNMQKCSNDISAMYGFLVSFTMFILSFESDPKTSLMVDDKFFGEFNKAFGVNFKKESIKIENELKNLFNNDKKKYDKKTAKGLANSSIELNRFNGLFTKILKNVNYDKKTLVSKLEKLINPYFKEPKHDYPTKKPSNNNISNYINNKICIYTNELRLSVEAGKNLTFNSELVDKIRNVSDIPDDTQNQMKHYLNYKIGLAINEYFRSQSLNSNFVPTTDEIDSYQFMETTLPSANRIAIDRKITESIDNDREFRMICARTKDDSGGIKQALSSIASILNNKNPVMKVNDIFLFFQNVIVAETVDLGALIQLSPLKQNEDRVKEYQNYYALVSEYHRELQRIKPQYSNMPDIPNMPSNTLTPSATPNPTIIPTLVPNDPEDITFLKNVTKPSLKLPYPRNLIDAFLPIPKSSNRYTGEESARILATQQVIADNDKVIRNAIIYISNQFGKIIDIQRKYNIDRIDGNDIKIMDVEGLLNGFTWPEKTKDEEVVLKFYIDCVVRRQASKLFDWWLSHFGYDIDNQSRRQGNINIVAIDPLLPGDVYNENSLFEILMLNADENLKKAMKGHATFLAGQIQTIETNIFNINKKIIQQQQVAKFERYVSNFEQVFNMVDSRVSVLESENYDLNYKINSANALLDFYEQLKAKKETGKKYSFDAFSDYKNIVLNIDSTKSDKVKLAAIQKKFDDIEIKKQDYFKKLEDKSNDGVFVKFDKFYNQKCSELVQWPYVSDRFFRTSTKDKAGNPVSDVVPLIQRCQCLISLSKGDNTAVATSGRASLIKKIGDLRQYAIDNYPKMVNPLLSSISAGTSDRYSEFLYTVSAKRPVGYELIDDFDHPGLRNTGTVCYANSYLQQLYHMPDVYDAVVKKGSSSQALNEVKNIFTRMDVNDPLATSYTLLDVVYKEDGVLFNRESLEHQQDANEFSQYLLRDVLYSDAMKGDDSAIDILNKFTMKQVILHAPAYRKYAETEVHRREENVEQIILQIPDDTVLSGKSITLEKCLDTYTQYKVEPEMKTQFNVMEDPETVKSAITFLNNPETLQVQFSRVDYDKLIQEFNPNANVSNKINTFVEAPDILNIKPYLDKNVSSSVLENTEYVIWGTIVHVGLSAKHGHFFSEIRMRENGKDAWYLFDDSSVFKIKDEGTPAFKDKTGANDGTIVTYIYCRKDIYDKITAAKDIKDQDANNKYTKKLAGYRYRQNKQCKINITDNQNVKKIVFDTTSNILAYDIGMYPSQHFYSLRFKMCEFFPHAPLLKSDTTSEDNNGVIFPSEDASLYINNFNEIVAYYNDDELRQGLIKRSECVLSLRDFDEITNFFGGENTARLYSSMTLFSQVPNADPVFKRILEKFFNGIKFNPRYNAYFVSQEREFKTTVSDGKGGIRLDKNNEPALITLTPTYEKALKDINDKSVKVKDWPADSVFPVAKIGPHLGKGIPESGRISVPTGTKHQSLALNSYEEARDYLRYSAIGARLLQACYALLVRFPRGKTNELQDFFSDDTLGWEYFYRSITMFSIATEADPSIGTIVSPANPNVVCNIFKEIIDTHFAGTPNLVVKNYFDVGRHIFTSMVPVANNIDIVSLNLAPIIDVKIKSIVVNRVLNHNGKNARQLLWNDINSSVKLPKMGANILEEACDKLFPQIKGVNNTKSVDDPSKSIVLDNLLEAYYYLDYSAALGAGRPMQQPGREMVDVLSAIIKNYTKKEFESYFGEENIKNIHSSITFFSQVPGVNPVFSEALKKYYGGEQHLETMSQIPAKKYLPVTKTITRSTGYRFDEIPFVKIQNTNKNYESALQGIKNKANKKINSDWMDFMFPQLQLQLQSVPVIKNTIDAAIYLENYLLEYRLVEASSVLLERFKTAEELESFFGKTNLDKLHSSMTLVSQVKGASLIFGDVISKFFGGKLHEGTVQQIEALENAGLKKPAATTVKTPTDTISVDNLDDLKNDVGKGLLETYVQEKTQGIVNKIKSEVEKYDTKDKFSPHSVKPLIIKLSEILTTVKIDVQKKASVKLKNTIDYHIQSVYNSAFKNGINLHFPILIDAELSANDDKANLMSAGMEKLPNGHAYVVIDKKTRDSLNSATTTVGIKKSNINGLLAEADKKYQEFYPNVLQEFSKTIDVDVNNVSFTTLDFELADAGLPNKSVLQGYIKQRIKEASSVLANQNVQGRNLVKVSLITSPPVKDTVNRDYIQVFRTKWGKYIDNMISIRLVREHGHMLQALGVSFELIDSVSATAFQKILEADQENYICGLILEAENKRNLNKININAEFAATSSFFIDNVVKNDKQFTQYINSQWNMIASNVSSIRALNQSRPTTLLSLSEDTKNFVDFLIAKAIYDKRKDNDVKFVFSKKFINSCVSIVKDENLYWMVNVFANGELGKIPPQSILSNSAIDSSLNKVIQSRKAIVKKMSMWRNITEDGEEIKKYLNFQMKAIADFMVNRFATTGNVNIDDVTIMSMPEDDALKINLSADQKMMLDILISKYVKNITLGPTPKSGSYIVLSSSASINVLKSNNRRSVHENQKILEQTYPTFVNPVADMPLVLKEISEAQTRIINEYSSNFKPTVYGSDSSDAGFPGDIRHAAFALNYISNQLATIYQSCDKADEHVPPLVSVEIKQGECEFLSNDFLAFLDMSIADSLKQSVLKPFDVRSKKGDYLMINIVVPEKYFDNFFPVNGAAIMAKFVNEQFQYQIREYIGKTWAELHQQAARKSRKSPESVSSSISGAEVIADKIESDSFGAAQEVLLKTGFSIYGNLSDIAANITTFIADQKSKLEILQDGASFVRVNGAKIPESNTEIFNQYLNFLDPGLVSDATNFIELDNNITTDELMHYNANSGKVVVNWNVFYAIFVASPDGTSAKKLKFFGDTLRHELMHKTFAQAGKNSLLSIVHNFEIPEVEEFLVSFMEIFYLDTQNLAELTLLYAVFVPGAANLIGVLQTGGFFTNGMVVPSVAGSYLPLPSSVKMSVIPAYAANQLAKSAAIVSGAGNKIVETDTEEVGGLRLINWVNQNQADENVEQKDVSLQEAYNKAIT
ncbi:MAG: DUF1810 family protein, partial [Christensenellaceae bacterium]|nr:DUF1810 family protein [Christensenellaceae bacterium]